MMLIEIIGLGRNHPVTVTERKVVFAWVVLLMMVSAMTSSAASVATVLRKAPGTKRFVVSHENGRRWRINEVACAIGEEHAKTCGFVVLSTTCGAVVQVLNGGNTGEIKPGETVSGSGHSIPAPLARPGRLNELESIPFLKALDAPCDRTVANLEDMDVTGLVIEEPTPTALPPASSLTTSISATPSKYHIGVGANFLSPLLRLDVIDGKLAYGFTGGLSTFYQINLLRETVSRARLWTALLHADYFLSSEFQGAFARGAAGYMTGTVEIVGRSITVHGGSVLGSAGYRVRWAPFTAALSLGAQYIYVRDASTVVQAISPVAFLEVGSVF